jgi:hypothetical protein
MVGLILVALGSVGCLNLGGGRQIVPLPWSYSNFAVDSVATQQKNAQANGAEFAGTDPGARPTGDQVITTGQNVSNARSTDASLADEQSQAVGQQSPGSAIDSSTGKTLDKKQTPTLNVGPAGGAQVGLGAATSADPAALTDAQAAALLARLRAAEAKEASAAVPPSR